MMRMFIVAMAVAMFSAVLCKPVEETEDLTPTADQNVHHLWKRFINSALTNGNYFNDGLTKIRTRRGAEEDCEKLELCKLHAKSSRNFLAAYELYFVNKENARLWDHHAHSPADCDRRFAHCLGDANSAPARKDADSAPARTDADSAPARTDADSAPARTDDDSVPERTDGDDNYRGDDYDY